MIRLNRYNQKQQIRMIVARQMSHVCSVPTFAAEALKVIWMRSNNHDVWAHVKFRFRLAGPVRHKSTCIHVGNAKPIDVLRPASKAIQSPLKEDFVETSGLVVHGAGRRTW